MRIYKHKFVNKKQEILHCVKIRVSRSPTNACKPDDARTKSALNV